MTGNHVLLIGFMGSGKTTIGRALSYRLECAVEDTDKLIESAAGMSISEIFATKGEGAFRRMETDQLYKILQDPNPKIYSLGGGTPVQMANQPLIKKCGKVIYLKISPEAVYERLKGDTKRPLLQCADPLAKIQKLIKEREPAYLRCADLVIDVEGLTRQEIVDRIGEYLGVKDPGNRKGANDGDEATGDQRTEPELPGDPGEGGVRGS